MEAIIIIGLLALLELIGRNRLKKNKEREYSYFIKEYNEMNNKAKGILNKISTLMHNHRREDLEKILNNGDINYDFYVKLNEIFDTFDKVTNPKTSKEEMIQIAHTIEGKIIHNGILTLVDLPSKHNKEVLPDFFESYYFKESSVLDAYFYKMNLYEIEYVQLYCKSCESKLRHEVDGYKCNECDKEAVKVSLFKKIYIKYILTFLNMIKYFLKFVIGVIDIFI